MEYNQYMTSLLKQPALADANLTNLYRNKKM